MSVCLFVCLSPFSSQTTGRIRTKLGIKKKKAIKFRFEFNGLEIKKIWKLRCGEAIKFEFELKELDMNQTGKSK